MILCVHTYCLTSQHKNPKIFVCTQNPTIYPNIYPYISLHEIISYAFTTNILRYVKISSSSQPTKWLDDGFDQLSGFVSQYDELEEYKLTATQGDAFIAFLRSNAFQPFAVALDTDAERVQTRTIRDKALADFKSRQEQLADQVLVKWGDKMGNQEGGGDYDDVPKSSPPLSYFDWMALDEAELGQDNTMADLELLFRSASDLARFAYSQDRKVHVCILSSVRHSSFHVSSFCYLAWDFCLFFKLCLGMSYVFAIWLGIFVYSLNYALGYLMSLHTHLAQLRPISPATQPSCVTGRHGGAQD
jgi:hypothetical protein